MLFTTNPGTGIGGAEAAPALPPFDPPAWLRSGHVQTIAGRYWPLPRSGLVAAARPHEIALPDGDRLLVLESTPPGWQGMRPTAMLVHGLAGCAEAPYVVRLASRLLELGVRVVRVNLRGSGRGFGLARGIYHAGRSDDLHEVVAWINRREADSPVAAVGFSLGANLVLKLAVECGVGVDGAGRGPRPQARIDCVLAANPPIDLAACARRMRQPENRFYDWNFVRWLRGMVARLHDRFPDLGPSGLDGVRSLYAFDDRYTARRNGFASADDYYEQCSLVSALGAIEVPGLIVHAIDDPFVPHEAFLHARRPEGLDLDLVRHGGHLGYLSRRPWQGDRRWLEARLSDWLRRRWGLEPNLASGRRAGRQNM